MNWKHFLVLCSLTFAGAALSFFSNVPEKKRYRQYSIVKAAMAYAVIVLIAYRFYIDHIRKSVEEILKWCFITLDPPTLPTYFNLIILLLFVIVKFLVSRQIKKSETMKPPIGYEFDQDGEIVLKKDFFFPGDLFVVLAWFSLIFIGFCFFINLSGFNLFIPFLPVLPFILLSECGWYLGGDRSSTHILNSDGKVVVTGAFSDMWEFYQKIWGDRVLAACRCPIDKQASEPSRIENRRIIKQIGEQLSDPGLRSNLLIEGSSFHHVFPDLARCFWDILVSGSRILVLLDSLEHKDAVKRALFDIFSSASLHGAQWRIEDIDSYQRQTSTPDILLATPRFLIDPRYRSEKWHEDIRLVFIPSLSSVIPSIQRVDTMMKSLKDIHPHMDFRVIVLSDLREKATVFFRNSFTYANMERYTLENIHPPQLETIIWRTESEEWFQHKTLKREFKFLGPEAVLSTIAWMYHVIPVQQCGQADISWKQRTVLLQKAVALDYFNDFLIEAHKGVSQKDFRLNEVVADVLDYHHIKWFHIRVATTCIVVRDEENNLTTALYNNRTHAAKSVFVHVVSSPYLLRDYMADNIDFFESQPVTAFMPVLSRTPYSILIQLVKRMTYSMIDGLQLLRILRECDENIDDAYEGLIHILEKYFGIEHIERNNLIKRSGIRYRYNKDENCIEEYESFGLMPEIYNDRHLLWLENYELTGTCNNEEFALGATSFDHLYQRYLPDQIHAFHGDDYLVKRVDSGTKKIELEYKEGEPDCIYSSALDIVIEALTLPLPTNKAYSKEVEIIDAKLHLDFCDAAFTVNTIGFFAFERGIDLGDSRINFVECDSVPERYYPHGRFLKLVFDMDNGIENPQSVAFTIAHLMNEMFRSFLPESCKFVHAGTVVQDRTQFFIGHENLSRYVPSFSVNHRKNDMEDDGKALNQFMADCAGRITIFLVEDSHQDMGICGLFFDESNLIRLFGFMYDYLKWMTEGTLEGFKSPWRKKINGRNDYLTYGGDEIPKVFDISGTITFLECLGLGTDKDTVHHHRKAFYAGKYKLDDFTITPDIETTRIESDQTTIGSSWRGKGKHQCDFCGKHYPQSDMTIIDSSLERCPECSAVAVKEFDGLLDLYRNARDFLEQDMGIAVRQDISVKFAHTRRIQDEAGIEFLPTSQMDPRAIGIAMSNGRIIMVENGAPSHSILATLVHEMTHIWQYDNLDHERMKAENGLLLIEGHAMWAELECLERKNLAKELCAVGKRRTDVYGEGYRTIVQVLKDNPNCRNPFEMLLEKYRV